MTREEILQRQYELIQAGYQWLDWHEPLRYWYKPWTWFQRGYWGPGAKR